jgi:multicomponent Na+:H+ antiporter subunit F
MSGWFLALAIAEMVVVGVLVVRLARGPSVSDRIVAVNSICTQGALVVLLFAVAADRSVYLDVAIWLASFSYLGGLVWARYLERGLL